MIHEDVVNYIVKSKGNCCEANRCIKCPFIAECSINLMRDYKEPSADAKAQRVRMALEILTKYLIGDISEPCNTKIS